MGQYILLALFCYPTPRYSTGLYMGPLKHLIEKNSRYAVFYPESYNLHKETMLFESHHIYQKKSTSQRQSQSQKAFCYFQCMDVTTVIDLLATELAFIG